MPSAISFRAGCVWSPPFRADFIPALGDIGALLAIFLRLVHRPLNAFPVGMPMSISSPRKMHLNPKKPDLV